MGQKVHPNIFRLGSFKAWDATWYASHRSFAATLNDDLGIRAFLKKPLERAGLSKISIARTANSVSVSAQVSRPGVILGRQGTEIEGLKSRLSAKCGLPVQLHLIEVRKPDLDAMLVASSVANQLERRILFRRAMRRAIQNAMRGGAKGIKIRVSGRLNGAEIARCEWYREGRVPLHTLRSNVDYSEAQAHTTYGVIGVKVWIYKGEIATKSGHLETSSDSVNTKGKSPIPKRGSK